MASKLGRKLLLPFHNQLLQRLPPLGPSKFTMYPPPSTLAFVRGQAASSSAAVVDFEDTTPPVSSENTVRRIKTKALTKTAAFIMQTLNKEAVGEVKAEREIPNIKPGDIVRLKVEVPENKRRVSTFRGIVMGLRRKGYSTTFRIRRFLAGIGVEMVLPLYSPNIKKFEVLEHRRVRRNKLYYLREKLDDKSTKITS